jgi:hypothetical protein
VGVPPQEPHRAAAITEELEASMRLARPAGKVNLDSWLRNPEAVASATQRATRANGADTPGVDGVRLSTLSVAQRQYLAAEVDSRLRRGYRPAPLRAIYRRATGKVRRFKIPVATDNVVLRVLLMGMQTAITAELAPNNYARLGLGQLVALDDVVSAIEAAAAITGSGVHVVKTDIARYFDSIDHVRLERLIRTRFSGRRTIRLIRAFLKQGQFKSGRGVAQGAPLSPLLANWYMTGVDWFFHRRETVFYARFVDDILIVVPGDIERARANLRELERQVHCLGLKLNESKTFITPATEGVDFLGFKLQLGAQGVEVTPDEKSIARLKKRLDEVLEDGNTTTNLHAAKAVWAAYFSDVAPQAWAIGDQQVANELAARLLRQPVAKTPAKGTEGTR